jgi:hypothetical protein
VEEHCRGHHQLGIIAGQSAAMQNRTKFGPHLRHREQNASGRWAGIFPTLVIF